MAESRVVKTAGLGEKQLSDHRQLTQALLFDAKVIHEPAHFLLWYVKRPNLTSFDGQRENGRGQTAVHRLMVSRARSARGLCQVDDAEI